MPKTSEYGLFKKHKSNREVRESHVVKLMKSIEGRNLLESRPILVNEKMEVIDGQHRLEAATRLKMPIHYLVIKASEAVDIYTFNENQKNWSPEDWFTFYRGEGYPEYEKIDAFMKRHRLDFRMASNLLAGKMGKIDSKTFKAGRYKFPEPAMVAALEANMMRINEVKDFVRQKTAGNKFYLNKTNFTVALNKFFNIQAVDFDLFMKKLSMRLDLFSHRASIMGYMNMFANIYNFRNHNPVTVHEYDPKNSNTPRLREEAALSSMHDEPSVGGNW